MLALRPLDHDAATPVMKNAPEQNQDRRRQTPAQAVFSMGAGEDITEETNSKWTQT